jgi:hypothetical protein
MLEGREALHRWGFPLPPRDNAHHFVRMRFRFPNHPDLRLIGRTLDWLSRLRNQADYDLSSLPAFATGARAQQAVREVAAAVALLDAIDADSARRATAIAAIRAAFP